MIIGLTGGIATGKSLVAKTLEELGATIVDADVIAREVVEPGTPAFAEIARAFPESICGGVIDRKALGRVVFSDPEKRSRLDNIVHPWVIREIQRCIEASHAAMIVLVVPLLFETGLEKLADEVWVVKVSEGTQQARLIARDQLNPEEALARIKSQWPLEEKIRRADVVIDNEDPPNRVKCEVTRLFRDRTNR